VEGLPSGTVPVSCLGRFSSRRIIAEAHYRQGLDRPFGKTKWYLPGPELSLVRSFSANHLALAYRNQVFLLAHQLILRYFLFELELDHWL
jgi:hypothetical protein